ncbi:MAG: hypothetical protein IJ614_00740 [Prevotella sp.]|nr:hypothetical protein [Prevotella sp.]
MKKIFLFATMLLSTVVFYSCKDSDDSYSTNVEREMMTMFRTQENTGISDDTAYPYYCRMEPNGDKNNQVHLYWFGVKGCAGYEIKMSIQSLVANGGDTWENPDNVLQSWIINDPNQLDLLIKDLDYSQPYRFAIRTLSAKGPEYNSKWYGYGGGQEWEDYTGVSTGQRYPTPNIITFSDRTKTSVKVNLNRAYSEAADEVNHYSDHFRTEGEGADKHYVVEKLKVLVSYDNPSAELPDQYKDFTLREDMWVDNKCTIDIDGLEQNCSYIIYVEDESIPIPADANYGKKTVRMRGDKIDPVLIPHTLIANEDTFGIQQAWDARRIDLVINDNYINNSQMPEGTVFELEGGKNYYIAKHVNLVKGLTLRTRPADLEAGLGRARVFLSGMDYDGTNPRNCQFMFGRNPNPGEDGATSIPIDSLIFEDIDFDSPLSWNYYEAGMQNGTGNYFFNQYSANMAVSVEGFVVRNCSFQRALRGFIRVQGPNEKIFKSILVENCEMYNCGMYGSAGADYGWIDDNNGNDPTSTNPFMKVVFRNNTFYNSPRGSMFINRPAVAYDKSVHYDITVENNTFVNYSSVTAGRNLFAFQNLPAGGAEITVKNNLFIQAKDPSDGRGLYLSGADIRTFTEGSNVVFNIENNWSTNENLTNGQIFSSNAFAATTRSFGAFPQFCTAGVEELDVHVDDIKNEELMYAPNPPYISVVGDGSDQKLMLNTAGLDGENHQPNTYVKDAYFGRKTFPEKASNLYYRNTDKVLNSEIYKRKVGASKWREGIR